VETDNWFLKPLVFETLSVSYTVGPFYLKYIVWPNLAWVLSGEVAMILGSLGDALTAALLLGLSASQSESGSNRRGILVSSLVAAGSFVLGWLIPGPKQTKPSSEADDIGMRYHHWSAQGRSAIRNWGLQPERYKIYPDAERIALCDPRGHEGLSLEDALEARRSRHNYTGDPLSPEELSRLLHAAQGITEPVPGLRTAPSAGALYPIEVYAAVHNVTGLEPGLYHYAVQGHELEMLQKGDFQAAVKEAGLGQDLLAEAAVCFILSAVFQRTRWKYRERTYRYVLLEAGHVGQNLYLAATSMGLGACAVGAFTDEQLNALLGLDGKEEAAVYIVAVGRP
jgi:SagB-type dehydrogenase family enzyme